jgi:hypothetical protein
MNFTLEKRLADSKKLECHNELTKNFNEIGSGAFGLVYVNNASKSKNKQSIVKIVKVPKDSRSKAHQDLKRIKFISEKQKKIFGWKCMRILK